MSIQTVEIRQFAGPATVELSNVGIPEIVEVRQGPQGPQGTQGIQGATGATGAAGPNEVTSATTTNFTANAVLISNGTNIASLATSTGGNHASDSGKIAVYGSSGELQCSTYLVIASPPVLGSNTVLNSTADEPRDINFPNASGTLALTSDIFDSVTSATTTDFTSGEVMFANSGFAGSLSRSGIDTRTSFPNDDVTAATHLATRGALVRRNATNGRISLERLNVETEYGTVSIQGDATRETPIINLQNGTISFGGTVTVSPGDGNGSFTMPKAISNVDTKLRCSPIVLSSGSFVAAIGQDHIVTATATLTDPTPSEGAWFRVIVRNGTATVGGTAYATSGTIIERSYHSGAWANRVYNETPVLAANVATFLQTPSSANLAAAVTDETGSGSLVFGTSPTLNNPTASTSSASTPALIASGPTTGVDTVQIRGTTTSSFSSIGLIDSGGTQRASFGYGGSTASSYASTAFFNAGGGIPFTFGIAGNEGFRLSASRGVSIGTTTDAGFGNLIVQGVGTFNGNQIRVVTSQTPASATATGSTGTICWDANYIYVCTATNTWKRTAIATW
jgi:hypothetical protein